MLGHAGGGPESISTILVMAGLMSGWIGISRLRRRAFGRLPRWSGIALVALAPPVALASLVVPALWPSNVASGPRPASTASIAIESPRPGRSITEDRLMVSIRLEGGEIVDETSTDLAPNLGHLHLFLDGEIVSMTYGLEQVVETGDLAAGPHRLRAEFVALDHAPFDPPVVATVAFVKEDL